MSYSLFKLFKMKKIYTFLFSLLFISGGLYAADGDSCLAPISVDFSTDLPTRLMYATDASAFKELPIAVCRPRHSADIKELVLFSVKNGITLIPRAAGTSLAGQVVGRGLVVDISKYMTSVKEVNAAERWVSVEPGVILDELNKELSPTGLFFSPETSTSTCSPFARVKETKAAGKLEGPTSNSITRASTG